MIETYETFPTTIRASQCIAACKICTQDSLAPGGERHIFAKADDWIVEHGYGVFSVLSDANFKQCYRKPQSTQAPAPAPDATSTLAANQNYTLVQGTT